MLRNSSNEQVGLAEAVTHGEEEEELCELALAEEVWQVLHGIVVQHRYVLILAGVFPPQAACRTNQVGTRQASTAQRAACITRPCLDKHADPHSLCMCLPRSCCGLVSVEVGQDGRHECEAGTQLTHAHASPIRSLTYVATLSRISMPTISCSGYKSASLSDAAGHEQGTRQCA